MSNSRPVQTSIKDLTDRYLSDTPKAAFFIHCISYRNLSTHLSILDHARVLLLQKKTHTKRFARMIAEFLKGVPLILNCCSFAYYGVEYGTEEKVIRKTG